MKTDASQPLEADCYLLSTLATLQAGVDRSLEASGATTISMESSWSARSALLAVQLASREWRPGRAFRFTTQPILKSHPFPDARASSRASAGGSAVGGFLGCKT